MAPGPWVCRADGHVEVDHDRVCLVCNRQLIATDRVGKHISRDLGELARTDDIATPGKW